MSSILAPSPRRGFFGRGGGLFGRRRTVVSSGVSEPFRPSCVASPTHADYHRWASAAVGASRVAADSAQRQPAQAAPESHVLLCAHPLALVLTHVALRSSAPAWARARGGDVGEGAVQRAASEHLHSPPERRSPAGAASSAEPARRACGRWSRSVGNAHFRCGNVEQREIRLFCNTNDKALTYRSHLHVYDRTKHDAN